VFALEAFVGFRGEEDGSDADEKDAWPVDVVCFDDDFMSGFVAFGAWDGVFGRLHAERWGRVGVVVAWRA
jgi:hypothetical protein